MLAFIIIEYNFFASKFISSKNCENLHTCISVTVSAAASSLAAEYSGPEGATDT